MNSTRARELQRQRAGELQRQTDANLSALQSDTEKTTDRNADVYQNVASSAQRPLSAMQEHIAHVEELLDRMRGVGMALENLIGRLYGPMPIEGQATVQKLGQPGLNGELTNIILAAEDRLSEIESTVAKLLTHA